jgi:hypothetical protein
VAAGSAKIGTVVNEILEVVPTQLKVHRHLRDKFSCSGCETVRLSQMLERLGHPVDRSVLTQWAKAGYEVTKPLVNALAEYVLSAGKLNADDRPFKVLAPGTGCTKKGRLWSYVRDERPWNSGAPPAVWYQYSPTWEGKYPQEHLKSFQGVLQADAYRGYGALYAPRAPGEPARVDVRTPL